MHCTCWHDKISPTTSQPSHSDGQFHLAKAFQAHSGTSASPSPLLEQSLSLGNDEYSTQKHCVSKQTESFAQVHLCSCGPLTSHTLTRTPKFQLRQKKWHFFFLKNMKFFSYSRQQCLAKIKKTIISTTPEKFCWQSSQRSRSNRGLQAQWRIEGGDTRLRKETEEELQDKSLFGKGSQRALSSSWTKHAALPDWD